MSIGYQACAYSSKSYKLYTQQLVCFNIHVHRQCLWNSYVLNYLGPSTLGTRTKFNAHWLCSH